jgi:hypothetical protein
MLTGHIHGQINAHIYERNLFLDEKNVKYFLIHILID